MRDYELMYIIKPDLDDETIAEIKARLLKIIEDFGGEFVNEVPGWGRKRMAYRIEDYAEGIYVLWNFKGKPETVAELDRVIKISDYLLRHIIIRKDEK
ncbi:Translation elongation factor EF1B/ribosomal protein S6 [Syntrophomonas zehnderi OL-4]|uniref:Small ribosomal subunit protein bS6 n=1 Tax=Syntrophomonas zehnderi OL-4 TaxID=690567 RepID=A0A0E4GA27_9FIRM|nr:30S ribosomal protein S6 [Syntrophomonas zehnderi]CFW99786.1 Translation elongation factor EF1B/ribosomal protein S6 [Syntrophomonas zehnderi OL-4]